MQPEQAPYVAWSGHHMQPGCCSSQTAPHPAPVPATLGSAPYAGQIPDQLEWLLDQVSWGKWKGRGSVDQIQPVDQPCLCTVPFGSNQTQGQQQGLGGRALQAIHLCLTGMEITREMKSNTLFYLFQIPKRLLIRERHRSCSSSVLFCDLWVRG